MPLSPGSKLGPYEIVAPLGAGGMGEVYRARDARLGRDVAIKIVADAGRADADRLARFEHEARAVAALSHPNVLAIFDVGRGDAPFLVTELLEGETLRARIAGGPLAGADVMHIALQLLAGLAAAHARGIVHRDLKPENIFITSDGVVKILDFGLAKRIGGAAGDDDQSATRPQTLGGMVLGTLGYMAPEQARGRDADHRADIFSAGAILFEMLTGQRAFRGASPADTISAILNDPPSSLVFAGGTPPSLVRVVRRCLAKDVNERFQSARDLAFAIESASDIRAAHAAAETAPSAVSSMAVLPFANISADPDNQYFSDGLAEDLINALTRVSGLRVASRTSSFRFRGSSVDVREIGRDLAVDAILEGSVRRAGARLRVTAQLVDAADGYHRWSERYDREMADVFDIQDEIVAAIVAALAPALVLEARAAVRRPTGNLEAYELYLKGRFLWNQRSPAVMAEAIRCFEDAIALDPDYALAYTGLADCYSILQVYGWTPAAHGQPRALEAVTRAMALDATLPEAHFCSALYVFHFERHWRAARRHFLDAIAANPRMAMFEAYFASFLAAAYEYDEARARLARAVAADPHSSFVRFIAAATCCLMGEFEASAAHAARALELQPESMGARWPQVIALANMGRVDEAMAVGERVIARSRAPIFVAVAGMLCGRAGRLAEARALGEELRERESRGEYILPAAHLFVQLGLGDVDGVRWTLAGCVDGGAPPFSIVATSRAWLDALRGDPEIDRLLDRLHDGARPQA